MYKFFALLTSFILSVFAVIAEETDLPPAPRQWQNFRGGRGDMRSGRGNMRGGRGDMRGGRGNMRGDRRNMMESMRLMGSVQRILAFESIREKFPAESTALDKIMLETEQKYADLAKKSGVELQTSLECNLIKLRLADTAGYDAAMKAVKADPRTGITKLLELAKAKNIVLIPQRKISMKEGRNREVPSSNRDIMRPDFRKLRAQYPEEMKQYDALRQQDPAKARQLLTDMMKRMNKDSGKK